MARRRFGDTERNFDASTIIGVVPVLAQGRDRDKSFVLRQVGGPGAPRELVLDLDEVVIGRSTQAHVSIESEVLSRKHVAIRRSGPEYVCQDLDSSNGMYLNGVKAYSAVLRDGDTLQIGDVVFVFREGT